uniref:Uncharacterized protein n=1 Tax=Chromera velia CCMP2878 TaxID=1169474 RepID=A0A0G4HMD4_9ALVE|eukprot:Cvel_7524.t1-p1 / transcript=Cvel_7524.t1 / gene=Cvel_7524 / organism=Chromera_velia_CCMP2878 / gene_product=Probable homogentisate phytyltransferase 1,, putative / transcript_product=Probable homogentisate phytyltransferase 1,, putative / location=Cvel_scaffold395:50508-53125(+) / protein_length=435 / sequence_SO=supercontig / SO=protein_coding / is_pseudo=false
MPSPPGCLAFSLQKPLRGPSYFVRVRRRDEGRRRRSVFPLDALETGQSPTVSTALLGETGGGVIDARGDSDREEASVSAPSTRLVPSLRTLWDFTRPHTLIGSALCIPALHIFALSGSVGLSGMLSRLPLLFRSVLFCLVPSLLMNVYITGLNQISDVVIDKVNKPQLPLPSERMTMNQAIVTVVLCVMGSLGLGFAPVEMATLPLRLTLLGSFLLGTAYSIFPFRLKRFPLLAALCVIAVRGGVINLGFFWHALEAVAGTSMSLSEVLGDPRALFSTLFFTFFGAVIALVKDVPDVRGDSLSGIRSFSVRVGQQRVFNLGYGTLAVLFGSTAVMLGLPLASAVCGLGLEGFGVGAEGGGVLLRSLQRAGKWWSSAGTGARCVRSAVCGGSAWACGSVVSKGRRVDGKNQEQVAAFYMWIWKLFYLSYLALPFIV